MSAGTAIKADQGRSRLIKALQVLRLNCAAQPRAMLALHGFGALLRLNGPGERMKAWIVGFRWFGWLVVVLMLAAMAYAAVRALLLYPSISV